jgi:hypothetical protein
MLYPLSYGRESHARRERLDADEALVCRAPA